MNIERNSNNIGERRITSAELELRKSGGTSFICHQLMPHPFHITVPFLCPEDPKDIATLYIQSSSGGLYDEDQMRLHVTLHNGSKLHLTSQASTIVHRAKRKVGTEFHTEFDLAENTLLEYLPDPIILMAGSKYSGKSKLNLRGNCKTILAEAFLAHDPNSSGEIFESCFSETSIFRNGKQIIKDIFFIEGPDYFSRIAGYNCLASVFICGYGSGIVEKLKSRIDGIGHCLAGYSLFEKVDLILVRIIALEPHSLLRSIESAWAVAREDMTGCVPRKRRK